MAVDCRRGSEAGEEKVQRSENDVALRGEASCWSAGLAVGQGGQLRGHQHVLLSLEFQNRRQVTERVPREQCSFAEGNDDARLQVLEQIRLHVNQQREERLATRALVPVDRELRHQKRRTSSANTPCFSTCSL